MTQLELAVETLPPEARPRIERLRDATRRLAHFTHQMLALARSSSEGALISERQAVDLGALLEDAASELLDPALAKDIDLGFGWPRKRCRFALDAPGDARNLIDNAITYTPRGGHVTVRCGEADDGSFVEVEDDGPAFGGRARQVVFERFYRLAPAAARRAAAWASPSCGRWPSATAPPSSSAAERMRGRPFASSFRPAERPLQRHRCLYGYRV